MAVFSLDQEGPVDDDEGEEGAPAFREWALPSQARRPPHPLGASSSAAGPAGAGPRPRPAGHTFLTPSSWPPTAHPSAACLAPLTPSLQELHGLWGSLLFEGDVKRHLLRYAQSALQFGAAGVDASMVGLGRLALLHGPPGTGKTTLAKALAHKLACRMASR